MGGRPLRSVLVLSSVLALGLASLPAATRAADRTPAPAGPLAAGTEIHLTQRVERTMSPDSMHVDLKAEVEGSDPSKAIAEVDRRMTAALERAKGAGAVSAMLGTHLVEPEHQTDSPVRWRATQLLALRGKDYHTILTLTAQLENLGLTVTAMRFVLAPETVKQVQGKMTKEALKALKGRAQEVAANLDMRVERFRSFSIGDLVERQDPVPPMRESQPAPPSKTGPTVWLTVGADVVLTGKD